LNLDEEGVVVALEAGALCGNCADARDIGR
jgi:hypothetical protein